MNIDTGEIRDAVQLQEELRRKDDAWVPVPKRLQRQAAKAVLASVPLNSRGTLARWARKERAKRKKKRANAAAARRRNRRKP